MIAVNGYMAYRNTIVGSPAPRIKELGDRMCDPRPGDLVLERSTIYRLTREPHPPKQIASVGILLRTALEPIVSLDELNQMHAENDYWVTPDETIDQIPKEKVWYIKPLDGSVPEYRWVNADFIAIFDGIPAEY